MLRLMLNQPRHTADQLIVRRVSVSELSPGELQAMARIHRAHYERAGTELCHRGLADKRFVFLGSDANTGEIVGFVTAKVFSHSVRGRQVEVFQTDDILLEARYRDQPALQLAMAHELMQRKLRRPSVPLYWLVMCASAQTYRRVTQTVPVHWPHVRRGLSARDTAVRDSICQRLFGTSYDSDAGVVRQASRLKARMAPFAAPYRVKDRPDPIAERFFVLNPGCANGDELALLGQVDHRALGRLLLKPWRRWLGLSTAAASMRRAHANSVSEPRFESSDARPSMGLMPCYHAARAPQQPNPVGLWQPPGVTIAAASLP